MTSKELIQIEDQYGAHNYHPLDVVLAKGKGIWVYDLEGNKFLDFLSAYSSVNQGHCHPRIVKALTDQAQKLTITSRAFRNDQLALFCKQVCELADMDMLLPMNSGAEAVETAIKAMRKWGYKVKGIAKDKAEIITCAGNFHGRTTTIVGFSTEELYKEYFGPYTPGFKSVPYGDALAIENAITENTAAVLIEPIQAEGGVLIPPEGYLKQIAEICKKHNVLLAMDEIQTGLGRTGEMFACRHEGVQPDIFILGKALSGGFYPVSAVVTNKEVLGLFTPGEHGSTFAGNPLACAIAREALNVIVEEELPRKATELGKYFMDQLRTINSDHIKEVRGKGLLIGVELKDSAGGARRFCEAMQAEGLLCKETHETVIRFAPPLVITKKDIDWAFERIKKVLETL
ncbi:ornithine--oxo-acid transaminase [candidate division KSB1 bacterium]|nr:ornithine--oxo-acid transaminase [candidate division KSB1 bacterium]